MRTLVAGLVAALPLFAAVVVNVIAIHHDPNNANIGAGMLVIIAVPLGIWLFVKIRQRIGREAP
jgi:uncharacterized protein with PQ loop repeat